MSLHVAFVGSREYPNLKLVDTHVHALSRRYPEAVVVSGGCRGVDQAAEAAAMKYGLRVVSFRPARVPGEALWCIEYHEVAADGTDVWVEHSPNHATGTWKRWPVEDSRSRGYGKPAFYRNGLIAELADKVMAYPCRQANGHLGGTGDTIRKARELGRPVFTYTLPTPSK